MFQLFSNKFRDYSQTAFHKTETRCRLELHSPLSNTGGDARVLLSGSGGIVENLLPSADSVVGI